MIEQKPLWDQYRREPSFKIGNVVTCVADVRKKRQIQKIDKKAAKLPEGQFNNGTDQVVVERFYDGSVNVSTSQKFTERLGACALIMLRRDETTGDSSLNADYTYMIKGKPAGLMTYREGANDRDNTLRLSGINIVLGQVAKIIGRDPSNSINQ